MKLRLKNYCLITIVVSMLVLSNRVMAVWFEPSAGGGTELTDNAKLNDSDKVSEVVTAVYAGAKVTEQEGALRYNAVAALNKHSYTKGTFEDKRYFNLAANADWAMIKDRFNWMIADDFSQRPIVSINSNTPDNIQDTNVFTFGARLNQPVSRRHNLSITPLFTQYYYETLLTDNRQYSLSANWNYQLFRLTNVGFSLNSREIDYLRESISDTSFLNLALVVSGNKKRSNYVLNMGSTNVKRDSGAETSGFSGSLNWLLDLSSRSQFKTVLSTELTDTSSVSFNTADPSNGNDVQVTADVVRNTLASLSYIRDDATFNSQFWLKYNKITYSDNPLDREIRSFAIKTTHPITRLLNSALYLTYGRTKQLQTTRLDKRLTVGANLKRKFSRKWHGLLDVKYRKKDSTNLAQNFNEYSIFATLVYGFGDVQRPTRSGG